MTGDSKYSNKIVHKLMYTITSNMGTMAVAVFVVQNGGVPEDISLLDFGIVQYDFLLKIYACNF